jgi:hypothetical protein
VGELGSDPNTLTQFESFALSGVLGSDPNSPNSPNSPNKKGGQSPLFSISDQTILRLRPVAVVRNLKRIVCIGPLARGQQH